MKLDRNINPDGHGKYALIKLRDNFPLPSNSDGSVNVTEETLDFGDTPETEFFVIRMKDKYASFALRAYAMAAENDDPEWANEVHGLADRAQDYIEKKFPD